MHTIQKHFLMLNILLAGFFGLKAMDMPTAEDRVGQIKNYLKQKYQTNLVGFFTEKEFIAKDLRNQDVFFSLLKEHHESLQDGLELQNALNTKMDSSPICQTTKQDGTTSITIDLQSLEALAVYTQHRDLFVRYDQYVHEIESEEQLQLLSTALSTNENLEIQDLGNFLLAKLKHDLAREKIKQIQDQTTEFVGRFTNPTYKEDITDPTTTDDLAEDNIFYPDRGNVKPLAWSIECLDLFLDPEQYAFEEYVENLKELLEKYQHQRNVFQEVYLQLRKNLNKILKPHNQTAGLPSKFPTPYQTKKEIEEAKRAQDALDQSFLQGLIAKQKKKPGKKKNKKRKKRGAGRKTNKKNNQTKKPVKHNEATEPGPVINNSFINAQALNIILGVNPDGSQVLDDNGLVITFGYCDDQATDRIMCFKDTREACELCDFHLRVTTKKNRYLVEGERDEDTVLHTFPDCLCRLPDQYIVTTYIDRTGRNIQNHIYFGEKLIDGVWEQGKYVLGFIPRTETCYHAFFERANLNVLKDQEFSVQHLLTNEEMTRLCQALDCLEVEA